MEGWGTWCPLSRSQHWQEAACWLLRPSFAPRSQGQNHLGLIIKPLTPYAAPPLHPPPAPSPSLDAVPRPVLAANHVDRVLLQQERPSSGRQKAVSQPQADRAAGAAGMAARGHRNRPRPPLPPRPPRHPIERERLMHPPPIRRCPPPAGQPKRPPQPDKFGKILAMECTHLALAIACPRFTHAVLVLAVGVVLVHLQAG